MAKQLLLFLGEEQVSNAEGMKEVVSQFANGKEILELVEERQKIMKDAWLTEIGHKRPGMNAGLPLKEALWKSELLDKEIGNLLKK